MEVEAATQGESTVRVEAEAAVGGDGDDDGDDMRAERRRPGRRAAARSGARGVREREGEKREGGGSG